MIRKKGVCGVDDKERHGYTVFSLNIDLETKKFMTIDRSTAECL